MNKIGFYLAIGCVALWAQTGQFTRVSPDLNDEQTLQEKYHIVPTEEGLLGALRHESPEVRSFVALRLAARGDKDAISPILAALAAEDLGGVKITQAAAAAELGSAEGFNALKSMCEDRSWSPSMRMVAAQTMVTVVGREECLSDILDVLRLGSDDGQASFDDRQASLIALNLLTYGRFKQVTPAELDEMRAASAPYLRSQDSGVRMAAGMCVRDLGGPRAISQLRAAIGVERDEAVRNSLAKDLLSAGSGR